MDVEAGASPFGMGILRSLDSELVLTTYKEADDRRVVRGEVEKVCRNSFLRSSQMERILFIVRWCGAEGAIHVCRL